MVPYVMASLYLGTSKCFLLWRSTKWPEDDEDIPTYTLAFCDGWQPPELREAPAAATETPVMPQEVRWPPPSKVHPHTSSLWSTGKIYRQKDHEGICFVCVDNHQKDAVATCNSNTACKDTCKVHDQVAGEEAASHARHARLHLQEQQRADHQERRSRGGATSSRLFQISNSDEMMTGKCLVLSRSCWTCPSCGGKWGTAEEKKVSSPTTSSRKMNNKLMTWGLQWYVPILFYICTYYNLLNVAGSCEKLRCPD